MKNTVALLIVGLLIVFLGNVRAECVRSQVLEDISLPGQKLAEGHRNMMSIPDGLEAMCEVRPFRHGLFEEARERLNDQRDLIPLLIADGELKPNQVRYYKAFFNDMEANLKKCETQAKAMRRRGSAPEAKKLVELNIRPNDLIDVTYLFREGGAPRKRIVSHKIWFGRIIEHDGYDLCQTILK